MIYMKPSQYTNTCTLRAAQNRMSLIFFVVFDIMYKCIYSET